MISFSDSLKQDENHASQIHSIAASGQFEDLLFLWMIKKKKKKSDSFKQNEKHIMCMLLDTIVSLWD